MINILIFLLVVISILLIGVILLQSGQGDMGAAMGGNAMNQAFGGQGADKLLVRITTTLAVIFMVLAISIQVLGTEDTGKDKEKLEPIEEKSATKKTTEEDKSTTEKEEKNQGEVTTGATE